ncbi:hypothetical protein [Streptomyces sp. NPDC005533]|uniref:hypothetical protein n=1 Tax=Streptomyces sp. NPDC005533 TaxID=3364723 RepID=UPI00368BA261
MTDEPIVVVHPPDRRGLRGVWVRGEPAGQAWTAHELRDLLDRSGLADLDLDDPAIQWRRVGRHVWPGRAATSHATGALLVAGLLGCMVLLISVGQVDALGSPYFANRMTGFLLMAGGAVQGVAAIAALDFAGKRQWPYSGVFVIAGVLIALAGNGLFLAMWAGEREYGTPLFPVFVALLVWALWALWVLFREKTWRTVPHPKGFAIGFMITTALTAANLVKSAWYEPSTAPVSVQASAKFGKATLKATPKGDFVYVPVTLRVKNSGKVPAYILGSAFWVVGRQFAPTAADRTEQAWKRDLETGKDVELYAKPPASTMVSTGEILGAGSYVNPGTEFVVQKLVTLPREAEFDALTAETKILTLRKDKATLPSGLEPRGFSWNPAGGPPKCTWPDCGDEFVYYVGYVEHSNNIVNVTREPRYLNSWWRMYAGGGDSQISAGVRPSHPAREESTDWEADEVYGIEKIKGGGDLVPFQPLVASALKDARK